MTSAGPYRWEEEDRESTGPNHNAIDPYSHWLLISGRDFDVTAFEPREDEADYSFIAAVKGFEFEEYIQGDWAFFDIKQVHDGDVVGAIDDDLRGERPNVPLYFPLPLRKRSIIRPGERLPYSKSHWEEPSAPALDKDKVVIVACIDDAINFAHRRFRLGPKASRVDFAWAQDGEATTGGTVPFGREWTRPEIERALADHDEDEESLLRALGLVDFTRFGYNPLARRLTHGTHVLDTTAGAEPDEPGLVNRRIIAVSLPALVTLETSGAHLTNFFTNALQYILIRTREISKALGTKVPLVVNFSYGIAGGPHDGGHYVERVIEELLQHHKEELLRHHKEEGGGPVDICLPAGNGNLKRGHASTATGQDERSELSLPWRVQPGDRTSSYLEIWLPESAADVRLKIDWPGASRPVEIPPRPDGPGNEPSPSLRDRPRLMFRRRSGRKPIPVARLSLDTPADAFDSGSEGNTARDDVGRQKSSERRQRILLALAPTEVAAVDRDPAPSGLWTVTVSAKLLKKGRIEAWIQRDDTPLGFRGRGRQSYFDDPTYRRFADDGDIEDRDRAEDQSFVRRQGTLNGIATGPSTVVIGGYQLRAEGRRMASYSATAAPEGKRPIAAAVSDRSRILVGVLGAGTKSGSRVAINGTSVAVPQAARAIAEERAGGNLGEGGIHIIERLAGDHDSGLRGGAATTDTLRASAGRLSVHRGVADQMKG